MQVGLAKPGFEEYQMFQVASYGFTILCLTASVAVFCICILRHVAFILVPCAFHVTNLQESGSRTSGISPLASMKSFKLHASHPLNVYIHPIPFDFRGNTLLPKTQYKQPC
jgi:hypothetical protein